MSHDNVTKIAVENGKVFEPIGLHAVSIGELMALNIPQRKRHLPWLPATGLVMVYGIRLAFGIWPRGDVYLIGARQY